jgi:hypothetical protein
MTFPYKTWANGVDAANQTNLQRYDDWIRQTEGGAGAVVLNGQTSGTVTLYQVMQGTHKKAILILANYKNTGNQYISLPVAFTTRGWFNIGDTGGGHLAFYTGGSGGSSVSNATITVLGSGGGTVAVQSFTANYCIGMVTAGFDTIQFQANSSAANGIMIVEGV